MSLTVVGKCSLCGGKVTIPNVWMGMTPPEPRCMSCHATPKDKGPTIQMEKKSY